MLTRLKDIGRKVVKDDEVGQQDEEVAMLEEEQQRSRSGSLSGRGALTNRSRYTNKVRLVQSVLTDNQKCNGRAYKLTFDDVSAIRDHNTFL